MSGANVPTTRPPFSIQGNRFAIALFLLLVVGVILTLSIAVRFQKVIGQLHEVRSLWPRAAVDLEPRYQAVDGQAADAFSEQDRDAWTTAYQRFLETSQYDKQSRAAAELESLIGKSKIAGQWESAHGQDLDKLLAADRKRESLQSDFVGWLTVFFLRLNLPPIFTPTTSKA